MVDAGVDASTLTFSAAGPDLVAGHTVKPLYAASSGSPKEQVGASASPLGLISGLVPFSFTNLSALSLPAGAYKIGIACTDPTLHVEGGHYWETPITLSNVTASSFSWAFGSVPSAPVLGASLTPADGSLSGTFTEAASTPALTGFTVTAHPASGPDVTLALGAGATSFAFATGALVNGTAYAVSVVATNSVGNSAPSNTVSGTPNPAPYNGVSNFNATPGVGTVVLTWTAPADHTPLGYDIKVNGVLVAGTVVGVTPTTTATTYTFTGTAGTLYSFTVTPDYASPNSAAESAIKQAAPLAAFLLEQDISATRPAGALILTQRCGVVGPLKTAFTDSYFGTLGTTSGTPGADSVATAFTGALDPTTDVTPGRAPKVNADGQPDGRFGMYPYPVDANGDALPQTPTTCGVTLSTAKLITKGAHAGQYFTANGQINQVTVVDTRDSHSGTSDWTINGHVGDFQKFDNAADPTHQHPLDSFLGSYLGWDPQMTSESAATLNGYYMDVVAGSSVNPAITGGLQSTTGVTLASAYTGHGLGIALLDARLRLLIPLTATTGTYTSVMTFTSV
jgi:hypothetical protein